MSKRDLTIRVTRDLRFNSTLEPSETYENNIKPKPPHIPDFNWDIKV